MEQKKCFPSVLTPRQPPNPHRPPCRSPSLPCSSVVLPPSQTQLENTTKRFSAPPSPDCLSSELTAPSPVTQSVSPLKFKMANPQRSVSKPSTRDAEDLFESKMLRPSHPFQVMPEFHAMKQLTTSLTSFKLDVDEDLGCPSSESAGDVSMPDRMPGSTPSKPVSTSSGPLADEIPKSTEEAISGLFILQELPITSDDSMIVCCSPENLGNEFVPPTQPEITDKVAECVLPSDFIAKECEVNLTEHCPGLRIRDKHSEVAAPRTDDSLHPVSDPQQVMIRARGHNNHFLVNKNDVPCMSPITLEQLCHAVFQMQTFFDDNQCREVTTFHHLPSHSYLSVSPDTQEVHFVKGILPGEETEDASSGVISLNGPSRSEKPPCLEAESRQGPDPCWLFLVTQKGNATIQPALRDNMSLDVADSGDRITLVDGRRCVFKILPADQIVKYVS